MSPRFSEEYKTIEELEASLRKSIAGCVYYHERDPHRTGRETLVVQNSMGKFRYYPETPGIRCRWGIENA